MLLWLLALPAPGAERPLRIVAIGDSLTAGYGLAQGEGFVPQLQAWLRANGAPGVEVIDMGVSGDTTSGGRARLDWALGDGADAVILELGANDMLRGIDPGIARANLAAMLAQLQARGLPVLLAGMKAPLNYGPDYKTAFEAMYPELADQYGARLYPFFLDGVVGPDMGSLMQEDGLHPNAAGVARIVAGIGPQVLELARAVR